MNKLLFSCLAFATVLVTGCLHSKGGAKPKEQSVSSEIEGDFRRRFIEKRVAELSAQGAAADAARTQAEEEFRTRYGFMGTPAK